MEYKIVFVLEYFSSLSTDTLYLLITMLRSTSTSYLLILLLYLLTSWYYKGGIRRWMAASTYLPVDTHLIRTIYFFAGTWSLGANSPSSFSSISLGELCCGKMNVSWPNYGHFWGYYQSSIFSNPHHASKWLRDRQYVSEFPSARNIILRKIVRKMYEFLSVRKNL